MPPKSDKGRSNKRQITVSKTNDIADRIQKSITEKFTDEQLTEFRDLFNMFDKENQGIVFARSLKILSLLILVRFSYSTSFSNGNENCWSNTN